MTIFVFTAAWVPGVILAGTLVGFFASWCISGLYMPTSQAYPTKLRSTCVSIGIDIGRIGAIIALTVTGSLTDADWAPETIYVSVGAVLLIATVPLLSMCKMDVDANRSTPRESRGKA